MSGCSPNHRADGNFPYRRCIVPECKSSSVITPNKLWIEAPSDLDTKTIWLNLAIRDPKKLPISKRQMYFCEDHFDLENDMENYEQYKTMGSVERVQMKPNCVPTRFDCQTDRMQTTITHQQPQYLVNSPVSSETQTQMPILQSLLTEDNCHSRLPQDVTNTALLVTLFCVCCLARDVPFVRLVTCCHAEFLSSMMMPEIKPKNQVICYQCHDMLKKIKQFKLQVEESFKLLSDSSENIPKNSNQRLNYYRRQNFSIVIPDANRKKKTVKDYNATIPQTIRIEPNIRYDHIINEEKIEPKDKTEKNPVPKSSKKKDKQTKIIEEAFKIINNNQNSESINLLANSLQNLSSTLLSDMIYPNFDLGSQFDTKLPAEINKALSSNITTSSTENISYVQEENAFIANSTNIAVSPAISTANITDVKEENAFKNDSINVPTKDIPTENFTNNLRKLAFKTESSNIATNLAISTENLINIFGENAFQTKSNNRAINLSSLTENLNNNITESFTNTEISTENLNSKITEAFTNADIPAESKNRADSSDLATNPAKSTENLTKKKTEKKSLGSYSINDYINFTNSTMSIEELINTNKDDGSILGDKTDERIISDTYGLGDNVAGEELIQPVTEKEDSIDVDGPEEQESVGDGESNLQKDSMGIDPPETLESVGGGDSNVQPVGTPIALGKRPILGGNIKQLTLTREQLMAERAKTAASQSYLRAPHKCESCIIGFQFYENLEDHFKRKHTRGKRLEIQCDVCRQLVDYGANYDMHTFWHHTRYQCVFCEQLFASYDKAALHYRKLHSKTRYRQRVKSRCPYKTGSCTGAPSEAKRAKLTPISTGSETTLED